MAGWSLSHSLMKPGCENWKSELTLEKLLQSASPSQSKLTSFWSMIVKGRELARERGIKVAGLLGELVHAKLQGSLTSVLSEMTKLQTEARFFIRDDIRAFILAQAGE